MEILNKIKNKSLIPTLCIVEADQTPLLFIGLYQKDGIALRRQFPIDTSSDFVDIAHPMFRKDFFYELGNDMEEFKRHVGLNLTVYNDPSVQDVDQCKRFVSSFNDGTTIALNM